MLFVAVIVVVCFIPSILMLLIFFLKKILHIAYFPFYSLIYCKLLLFLGEEGIKIHDPNEVGNKTMCMLMGVAFMAISLWNLFTSWDTQIYF